jgi:putative two-component system response regulator
MAGQFKMAISKPKILVVDDHPDSRVILVLAMEKWGYEVVEARDGKEAMDQIKRRNFNLVVVDLAMPFMSGLDVARSMRTEPRTKDIPILAVTALATSESRKRCSEAGVSDFLSKPFSMADLKWKVEALLGQRKRK